MAKRNTRKSKKQSATYQQYMKERRRIQSFLRRAEKRGIITPPDFLPAIPKRVTEASVRRLKRITPKYIYEHAVDVVEAETGEILTPQKILKAERQARNARAKQRREERKARKAQQTILAQQAVPQQTVVIPNFADIIIDNFINLVTQNMKPRCEDILMKWLNDLINREGKDAVANMLEDAAQHGVMITWKAKYDEKELLENLADFLDYLDVTPMYREELTENLDEFMYL